MAHLKISKGFRFPIKGKPLGNPQPLIPSGELFSSQKPKLFSLDLGSFDDLKFKVLVKVGDRVKLGQPLVEDKESPGRFFASPAGGSIRRNPARIKAQTLRHCDRSRQGRRD